jgi:putative ABC transport system permease protein
VSSGRKFYIITKIAARCLFQHKLRSALSVLGVVCGVIAVLAMVSIGEGAKQRVIRQIEALGIGNIYIKTLDLAADQQLRATEKLSQGLSVADVAKIHAGCPQIQASGYLKTVSAALIGIANAAAAPQIVAVNPGYAGVLNLYLARGRNISGLDLERRSLVCVLGADVSANTGMNWQVGQDMRIGSHLFKIVGIFERIHHTTGRSSTLSARNHNEMIFIPFGAHFGIDPRHTPAALSPDFADLTEIVAQVTQRVDVLPAAGIMKRIIDVAHHHMEDVQIVVPLQLLKRARETQRTFNLVMGAIAAVSLLVGGIGIMNIMLATVTERTREIGVRRAVGATKGDIVYQFVIETVALTIVGGMVGVLSGVVVVKIIAQIGGWPVAITLWAIIVPLLMAVSVGVFFGLYPALKAAKMNPARAFRYE